MTARIFPWFIMPSMVRPLGLVFACAYAAFIVWTYRAQPQTVAEVTGGLAAEVGAYRIDQQAFDDGLGFFRRDLFEESRAAFARADPAQRDARTQFYIAYSYYRQGWGRVYNDDLLFKQGLDVAPSTPEAFAAYIRSEKDKWEKVVKAAKLYHTN